MKPKLPNIKLEHVLKTEIAKRRFLSLETHDYIAHYEDGTKSKQFTLDCMDRIKLDASIVIPYYIENTGSITAASTKIVLRSAIRHAHALRVAKEKTDLKLLGKWHESSFVIEPEDVSIWEYPAGLIEQDERPIDCAARELEEETGYKPVEIFQLGDYALPIPGILAERMYFFAALINPEEKSEPSLDGSPMEENAAIEHVSIDEVLSMIDDGSIKDMKTQIGTYRLMKKLGLY